MKVAKFGGTSMANAEQIKKVCSIILSDPEREIIVVSAPGKRNPNDTKVTDLLIRLAEKFLNGANYEQEFSNVISRYEEIAKDLGMKQDILKEIENDLNNRIKSCDGNRIKFLDTIKAAGEDNIAKLLAKYLKENGYDAKYINPKDAGLYLTEEYGNAQVLDESYSNLNKLKDIPGIKIFPGFFGYTKSGSVVTFPRGGSDITGSILAAAVKADIYENFTDVDSVFCANPNIIQNPKPIKHITYREMRELSYGGFTVLHEETLLPVYKAGIPVNIRNTNNPSAPGTIISLTREINPKRPVVGIAAQKGFAFIDISKYLMNREIGFGRKLLQILEENNLPYEHTPSGIDNISVILDSNKFTPEKEKIVVERIIKELNVDSIEVHRGFSIVFIVGEGMRNTVGIAARATQALAIAGINLEMINQGASEISMMFGVADSDMEKAVRALYNEFF